MVLKKGFLFTIDSIIGASIIIMGLLLVNSFYIVEPSYTSLDYASHDLISALSRLKISEVNNAYVDELISSGEITNTDNSILEQIGEFWALDKIDKAGNLTKEFTNDFVDENLGFGFYIEGEKIYSKDKSHSGISITSKKMISGIQRYRTREGFTARAIATKVSKNTTEVFMINPKGSSHGPGNKAYLTKKFYLNSSNIINATLFISVHWGTSSTQSNKFYINNHAINVGNPWLYEQEKNKTHIGFDVIDITNYVTSGWNELKIELIIQSDDHTHIHPGSKIIVEYESSGKFVPSKIVEKRLYFDNVLSKGGQNLNKATGAWSVLPVFVPKGVIIKNATLHVVGKELKSFGIPEEVPEKGNVQLYLNDGKIEILNITGTLNKSYNIKDNLNEGTNVISIYLNCYPDYFFGKDDTLLYSDPENDPEDSSYVDIKYEIIDTAKLKYGKIDISIVERFNKSMSTNKSYTKDFEDYDVIESFIQVAQLDSGIVNVKANSQNIFTTPRPLATPSSIYIDSDYLLEGENNFNVFDSCDDCYILNETTLQYYILIPSLVGYGQIFDSEEEAIADAEERLNLLLGDYVQATQIDREVNPIGGVPSLWGPIIAEVRAWH
ncbi:MAG: hypothetical protein KJ968_05075 [Nanoarchaeota archaeon]|nr:hypothetical protein [Nanoarchaeota archaeon]